MSRAHPRNRVNSKSGGWVFNVSSVTCLSGHDLSVVLLEEPLSAQEGLRSRIGGIVVTTALRAGVEESVRRALEE